MLAGERRLRLLEQVAENQVIAVSDLARRFGVSEMTIRRDIRRLERDGFLRQSYGGATAHLTRSFELAINARALQHAQEKRLIALEAAKLIASARTLFVGIGTTCEQFARYLAPAPDLLVVTGSLPVASLLGTRPVRVVALGGAVRRDELSVIGPLASLGLSRFRFDLAVVGAAGVSARWGVTDLEADEAELNRQAIELAERTMVIADGSKVGSAAPVVVAPAEAIDLLVTDASAPGAELAALRAGGVPVRIVSRQRHDDSHAVAS
jgi:DeoR/GlpR family transcriptional regulator of sugar metabolism